MSISNRSCPGGTSSSRWCLVLTVSALVEPVVAAGGVGHLPLNCRLVQQSRVVDEFLSDFGSAEGATDDRQRTLSVITRRERYIGKVTSTASAEKTFAYSIEMYEEKIGYFEATSNYIIDVQHRKHA